MLAFSWESLIYRGSCKTRKEITTRTTRMEKISKTLMSSKITINRDIKGKTTTQIIGNRGINKKITSKTTNKTNQGNRTKTT